MPTYLDPKSDLVFKRIFGEHPHLLKSFLNAVLPLSPERQIVELSYLPTELVPVIPTMKRTLADVRCVDRQGQVFIVEMQIEWTDSFKQRLLFESGQAFIKQLQKGEDYQHLQPVYGLGLVATTYDPSPEHWYHHYQLVNIGKPVKEIIEHLQLIFIELPKFPVHSPAEKRLRLLWLRFMREINESTRDIPPELAAIPEISEAISLTEVATYSPGELQAYESYWDMVSTEKTLMSGKFLEGKAQGRAEGKAEGLAEGEAKGRSEGKADVARKLLEKGIDIDIIAVTTGFTPEDIRKL